MKLNNGYFNIEVSFYDIKALFAKKLVKKSCLDETYHYRKIALALAIKKALLTKIIWCLTKHGKSASIVRLLLM